MAIMCKALEHSSPEAKAQYLAGMEKSCRFKLETIRPWLIPGGQSIDLGCADGAFTREVARYHAGRVVGIDPSAEIVGLAKINAAADTKCAGVDFQVGDAETFKLPMASNVVCSSVMHEVFSYGKGRASVEAALKNIFENLAKGGRLIIRDFVRPENRTVDFLHDKEDITPGHSYGDFMGLEPDPESGTWESYKGQNIADIYEYIYRKDFHTNWESELKETYGFWTLEEAKALVEAAGFKLIHVAEIENPWITENRLDGKIMIDNPDGSPTPFPKYQCVIVAEKE